MEIQQSSNESVLKTYEDVVYQSQVIPQSDPDVLAIIARLLGAETYTSASVRVLEIGCGTGTNLINIGLRFPGANCLGIDLSPRQIEVGQETIATLGVSNVRLEALDMMEFGEQFGEFDLIIAHGVYSWVPAEIQKRLLDICRQHLSPVGIAMISYNVKPGWNLRGTVRDMMMYQASAFVEPERKVREARAILQFLANLGWDDADPYGIVLKREMEQIQSFPDYYLYHEFLELNNEAVYFHEFNARAEQAGLQYLGDAVASQMFVDSLPQQAQQVLRNTDNRIRLEQYMDFVRNRYFRHTMLIRGDRTFVPSFQPERIASLKVGLTSKPVDSFNAAKATSPLVLRAEKGMEMRVVEPLQMLACQRLSDVRPAMCRADELFAFANTELVKRGFPSANAEAKNAFYMFLTRLVLFDFACASTADECWATTMPSKPKCNKLALHQIESSAATNIATFSHGLLNLGPPAVPFFALMDGTRTVPELIEAFIGKIDSMPADPRIQGITPAQWRVHAQEWLQTALEERVLARE